MEKLSRNPVVRPLIGAVIVSLLMTASLGYMVESRASILRYGTEVRLKTAPVDPRDLLRGDYVILNYNISTVPAALIVGPKPANGKQGSLFVRLLPDTDGFWIVKEASFQPLPEKSGTVVLKSFPFSYYDTSLPDVFGVPYGIDRYFVPEGQGKTIENSVNTSELAVVVKVSKTGVGQIARLEMNGKPLYDEPLY